MQDATLIISFNCVVKDIWNEEYSTVSREKLNKMKSLLLQHFNC